MDIEKLLVEHPFIRIVIIAILAIFLLSLYGCNKKAPEPVPESTLTDQCFRSDTIKSCEVKFKIIFKDGVK